MEKSKKINYLEEKAKIVRKNVIQMVGVEKVGHIGGSCSIADIVAALYFYKMKHNPKNPRMEDRDRFLLSKGHAALVQYGALAECGYFDKAWLKSCKKLGSKLQGHPDYTKTPGVEANTGSLGQGLSIGLGMALGLREDKLDSKVYVVIGDGELAEGQIWEAAMAAVNYKLDNLVAIVDHNKLQATGMIEERFNTLPIIPKWQGFGWNVIEINGHDMNEIVQALDNSDNCIGKPTVIIANTVKGKGISFAENVVSFHNAAMNDEQYKQAIIELS